MRSVEIRNELDSVSFHESEYDGEIDIYVNDIYVSTIHKKDEPRGWDEVLNIGNDIATGDIDGEIKNSWMNS